MMILLSFFFAFSSAWCAVPNPLKCLAEEGFSVKAVPTASFRAGFFSVFSSGPCPALSDLREMSYEMCRDSWGIGQCSNYFIASEPRMIRCNVIGCNCQCCSAIWPEEFAVSYSCKARADCQSFRSNSSASVDSSATSSDTVYTDMNMIGRREFLSSFYCEKKGQRLSWDFIAQLEASIDSNGDKKLAIDEINNAFNTRTVYADPECELKSNLRPFFPNIPSKPTGDQGNVVIYYGSEENLDQGNGQGCRAGRHKRK